LRSALAERSAGAGAEVGAGDDRSASVQVADRDDPGQPAHAGHPGHEAAPTSDAEMLAYYAARAPEYDDWYLRRGRYSHGAIQDQAWQMELDTATTWLDGLPISGRIVELAAGTGWWSPLLAQKGELWLSDALEAPLDRARERLVAHGLRAHLHVRDAWAEPDQTADALFTGFWLSHVPRDRLDAYLRLARSWLRPGGLYAFIDSQDDPISGATDRPEPPKDDQALRRTSDGRTFRIPKVFYSPRELEEALRAAGFADASVTTSGHFFLLGRATA
jgi:demethylmenaquinone methyltransferase/2-methoxy-6-polyprenyl-1,4-benzoquinol methylase